MRSKQKPSLVVEERLINRRVFVHVRKSVKSAYKDDWTTFEYGAEADVPDSMEIDAGMRELSVEAIVALRKAFTGGYNSEVAEREREDSGIGGTELPE